MDPLAHTLVGASLAESGLRRLSPLATATLVLGANAPDIDILSAFQGQDASLGFRRGITHGVLAMLLLPVVLTGAMLAWDRLVRRRRNPDAPPARARPLFVLALLSILTHPALDWLNTYGVRLLSPFDGRWFYGDAVFIIDPWLWLLMAAPVVLARSTGKLSAAAFILLGCGATALITLPAQVPLPAKLAWLAGVLTIVALRVTPRFTQRVPRLALVCLALLVVYIGAMVSASRVARTDAIAWLAQQHIVVEEAASDVAPGNPFVREVIARAGGRYYIVERTFGGAPGLRFSHAPIDVGPRNAITSAALLAPSVRGLRAWLRFPSIEVEETSAGYRVSIRDVRYARSEARLGQAVVELDHALRPR
jgi:inner membrane protein